MNLTAIKIPVLLSIIATLFLFSCDQDDPRRIDYSSVPDPISVEGSEKITTESGLEYYIIEEGICPSGNERFCSVNPTDQVSIYYTKRVKNDPDRIIASSYANDGDIPVNTNVQNSRIITEEGFKRGIIGMKKMRSEY
jgi:hypothetical protein